MTGVEVAFPNLGITFHNITSGFYILDFKVAFYGCIIAFGMVIGYLAADWQARKTGQNPDLYLDYALIGIPIAIVCARIYYVAFSWDSYKDNLLEIFNVRNGGLAIYGGIIGAVTTALIFCRIRKVNVGLFFDTGILGLITGQIIGRWGNFFNCEAFGGYAGGNLFAMQLPWSVAKSHMSLSSALAMEQYVVEGTILVHPTFLYESVWNMVLLILLILYGKHKKFDGEVGLLYMVGYGLGRFWIESLRTDQLLIWGTQIPVSMALAAVLALGSFTLIAVKRYFLKKAGT